MPVTINGLNYLNIAVILLFLACVGISGCIGSASGQWDKIQGDPGQGPGIKDFPPLFNYQVSEPGTGDDGIPGRYIPGDVIQPAGDSSLFDNDIALIVLRDTGKGTYEIGGLVWSGGTWYRIPDAVPGPVSHTDVERLFPKVIDNKDYHALPVLSGWRPGNVSEN
jgi:hypothetical protein